MSGINQTMKTHLKNVVKLAKKKVELKNGDNVLDIASNDGTLLNYYQKNVVKVGVDPVLNKFKSNYNNINYSFAKFFE